MPYINFKEERYKGNIQLDKRKENNKNIINKLTAGQNNLNINYNKKYSFKKITNKIINNLEILKENQFIEIAKLTIIGAYFKECKFYNIKFKECTFYGCIFEECDFGGGGVVFENCYFTKVNTEKVPSLNIKDNLSCEFKNCKMYVKFSSTDLTYLIIENSLLKNSAFELSDMSYMIMKNCEINKVQIADSNISSIKVISTYIIDLEFTDKLISKMDVKTFFDKIEFREKTRDEYEGIYKVYQNIADKFEENRFKNNFGEYYYLCKSTERRCLDLFPKIYSYLSWLTCGYGERAYATLISSLVLIFIFAVVYYLIGINVDGQLVKLTLDSLLNFNLKEFIFGFDKALNISTGMFVGAGLIKVDPVEGAYFVTDIEMIIGSITIGIGIGTLTKKIVR